MLCLLEHLNQPYKQTLTQPVAWVWGRAICLSNQWQNGAVFGNLVWKLSLCLQFQLLTLVPQKLHTSPLKGTYYAKWTCTYCLNINVCWHCVYTSVGCRAASNDYFDNRFLGQLFFWLIWLKTFFDKNITPHSVQCLLNKCSNWMIHIQ